MENSKIEWCEHTFNPFIGCTRISPACDHCYAADLSARTFKVKWGAGEQRKRTSESYWRQPIKWNAEAAKDGDRPRVFCASLADVFDNEIDPQWRVDLLDLIRKTQNLDWMLLTKRIGNVRKQLIDAFDIVCKQLGGLRSELSNDLANAHPIRALGLWLQDWIVDRNSPANVYLGITICNQAEADRDIPKLLATPAAKRFLSIEPMLGSVRLDRLYSENSSHGGLEQSWLSCLSGKIPDPWDFENDLDCEKIDLVICGGESGPNARPSHPDWFRLLRDQCARVGVPFMFKQWGEWLPARKVGNDFEFCDQNTTPHNAWLDKASHKFSDAEYVAFKVGKKAAGRLLDGVEHNGRIEL